MAHAGPLKFRPLAAADVRWFHDLIERINRAIAAAVSQANVRAVYVSPDSSQYSFVGHDVCSRSSWFVPLLAFPIDNSLLPNEKGNDQLAYLLRHYAGRSPG